MPFRVFRVFRGFAITSANRESARLRYCTFTRMKKAGGTCCCQHAPLVYALLRYFSGTTTLKNLVLPVAGTFKRPKPSERECRAVAAGRTISPLKLMGFVLQRLLDGIS